jgi:hypothetical protein
MRDQTLSTIRGAILRSDEHQDEEDEAGSSEKYGLRGQRESRKEYEREGERRHSYNRREQNAPAPLGVRPQERVEGC